MRTPRWIVPALGSLLAVEGIVGVVSPGHFRSLVILLQSRPAWPASVVLRAALGAVLIAAPPPVRNRTPVRVVGVITLLGAVVGLVATDVEELPHGPAWRVPAALLALAGIVVVSACAQESRTKEPRRGTRAVER